MRTLLLDLQYGVRLLVKSPGFAFVAIFTLALGIGANTAIFSLVNAVMLRPLPYKDPDRLVVVWERRASTGDTSLPVSAHEYAAWKSRSEVFDGAALYIGATFNFIGPGEPTAIEGLITSADYFAVLGVPALHGRTFAAEEDQAGGKAVVVINEGLWQRRFASDPAVVGRNLTLNDRSYTVIGVVSMPELARDVWVPMDVARAEQQVGRHNNLVVARLKTGVSLEKAESDLARISTVLEKEFPRDNVGHSVRILPLHEQVVGGASKAIKIFFGAVVFVLLIACANVANLLLARAGSRQREVAIKIALGASRFRLIRQFLTESLLLAGIGGSLGLLLALWIVDLLPRIDATGIPRIEGVRIDGWTLAATAGFSLLTGILTGLVPAWRGSKPTLTPMLNEGARSSLGLARRRFGGALVVLEIALALVLLVGAGLMLKSFVRLMRIDPGFNSRNVLTADVFLPGGRYPNAQKQQRFFVDLLEAARNLPGVESAALTTEVPMDGGDSWVPFTVEGRPAPAPGEQPYAAFRVISEDYFKALQVPLHKGRFFDKSDARIAVPVVRWFAEQPNPPQFEVSQPAPVAIVNETMARQLWPNEDPIGKKLKALHSPWLTVIGVVGDMRHSGLDSRASPQMFLSYLQEPRGFMTLTIRTAGDPLDLARAVRQQVAAIDKDQPISVTTLEQVISRSVANRRFNAALLMAFGVVALILAVTGVFSVINYSVSQRTHEIGVRLALGAQRRDILKLVVGEGGLLAFAGIVLGVCSALALTHLIASLLYGVSTTDFSTFAIVSVLLGGVALLGSYVPARRATRVDPLVALRHE